MHKRHFSSISTRKVSKSLPKNHFFLAISFFLFNFALDNNII